MITGLALALALALAPVEPAPVEPAPVAAASDSGVSLFEAGRAIAAGRLDQAKAMLASAVAAGAKGEPVDRLLADLAFARGENEQALLLYKGLLVAHPDEALLLERGGIASLKLQHADEATRMLDRATRVPGASWRAWNARGVAADRQGRWDEAEAAYAKATVLDPARAEVPNNLGWSMMLQGQWPEALAAFEKAFAVNPGLPQLANNLELARAAVSAELPKRLAGESDASFAARLNDAGVVAATAGQAKRAEAAFAQAIELRSRWFGRAAENLAELGAAK